MDLAEAKANDINGESEKFQQMLKDPDRNAIFRFWRRAMEPRSYEFKADTASLFIEIEYPRDDIAEELQKMLQRVSVRK